MDVIDANSKEASMFAKHSRLVVSRKSQKERSEIHNRKFRRSQHAGNGPQFGKVFENSCV